MATIDGLYKLRDKLAALELLHSTEALLESHLAKTRTKLKVIRNQIINSCRAKQWADATTNRLKFPSGKDAFISWQRAMVGAQKSLLETASYAVRIRLVPTMAPPRVQGLPPAMRKELLEKYEKHVAAVNEQNKALEAEAKRLNDLFDEKFQSKIEPALMESLTTIRDAILAVMESARSQAQARIDSLPANSEDRAPLQKRFNAARVLETDMQAGGDATIANIGKQAWSGYMLCLK